jgi:hypothetical protein
MCDRICEPFTFSLIRAERFGTRFVLVFGSAFSMTVMFSLSTTMEEEKGSLSLKRTRFDGGESGFRFAGGDATLKGGDKATLGDEICCDGGLELDEGDIGFVEGEEIDAVVVVVVVVVVPVTTFDGDRRRGSLSFEIFLFV